jgi:hypothetical protein
LKGYLVLYYGFIKLAVSVLFPLIVTDNGLPVPVTLPVQFEKLYPVPAFAVNCTTVPE